jgi:hypothetical protein
MYKLKILHKERTNKNLFLNLPISVVKLNIPEMSEVGAEGVKGVPLSDNPS